MISARARPLRPFLFERDTFAFAHELVWEYRLDAATGQMVTVRATPPPTYYHRCFVLVRAVRQFFYHARFEPSQPPPYAAACRRLIRTILSRNPRQPSAEQDQVIVPGYDGLHSLSRAWESLLKAECGEAWESYFLRSHWRMVFPLWRRHQQKTAQRLEGSLAMGALPVVHLVRFPQLTINHGIVLFGAVPASGEVRFQGYDPNIPANPVELTYRQAERTFYFPRNHYWAGGKLHVIEIFRNWLY
jgi:hypothetical protein